MVRINANRRRPQCGSFLVESPVAKFANHDGDPFDNNVVSADPGSESVVGVDFAESFDAFRLQSPNKLAKIKMTSFLMEQLP